MENENTTSEKSLADKHAERMKRLRELHTKRVSTKYTNNIQYNLYFLFNFISIIFAKNVSYKMLIL